MKQYEVSIEETLRRKIFVNAESEEEAWQIADEAYNEEKEVLHRCSRVFILAILS